MANGGFKIKNSANLSPQTGSVVNTEGDLSFNDSTKQVEVYTTAVESITTNSNTQTITNKTISGASNTITNIPASATNATPLNTPSTIVSRDGSGNFAAGTVTAALTGTASGNTTITPAAHSVVVSGAANVLSTVAPSSAAGLPLISAGASADPTFGVAVEAGGGTHQSTYTTGDLLYASASNTLSKLGIGSASQSLQVVNGIPSWQTVQAGSKNYITYNNFENNSTTGWSLGTIGTLTNGIPTGTPTFGSGASGNLSIAIVSSGQLSGNYSLSYVSSAATTQGNMLATQVYNVDASSQAQVMGWSFDYSVPSGAANGNFSGTSSNSFGVAVWDVTNSVWLGTTGNFNLVGTSFPPPATGIVQLGATTAQIRFVIYNVNASSGAITLYLDDFFFGPQVTSVAPAMSDWSANPNLTLTPNNAGTITNAVYESKRIGDSLRFRGNFTVGTPSGSTFSLTLPVSIDSSKLPSNSSGTYLGNLFQIGSLSTDIYSGNRAFTVFYDGSTTNQVFVALTVSSNTFNKSGGTSIFNTGDACSFEFEIPVAGYSSNTVSSSSTDTRVIAASYTFNKTSTGIPSGTTVNLSNTYVTYSKIVDTTASFNSTTGTYTVPVTGQYKVNALVEILTGGVAAQPSSFITQSGSISRTAYLSVLQTPTTSSAAWLSGSAIFDCVAGDVLQVQVAQNTGSAQFVGDDGVTQNYVCFERLSGSAVVQASESVNARYQWSGTQSIANNSNVLLTGYTTKEWDTHNAFSPSTGYICPISGKYRMSYQIGTNTTVAASAIGNQFNAEGYKNSLEQSQSGMSAQTTTAIVYQIYYSDVYNCNAGDTLSPYLFSNLTGSSVTVGIGEVPCWITFERIGN